VCKLSDCVGTTNMNCVITVKGDGVGRYGKPKVDRTGPLSEFLVDNSVFYVEITKHLQQCSVCSVNAVLTEYLRRRVQIPKFKGQTGASLVKRAVILERLAKKKGEALTPGLVNEIIWRCDIWHIIKFNARLSLRERFTAFKFHGTDVIPKLKELSTQDRYLVELVRGSDLGKITDQELEELLVAAEVMFS
jgi:hypothetical protein